MHKEKDESETMEKDFVLIYFFFFSGMNPGTIGLESDPKAENPDEEKVLVHQEFLSDPEVTVSEVLQREGLSIVDFVRYETGETQVKVEEWGVADDGGGGGGERQRVHK